MTIAQFWGSVLHLPLCPRFPLRATQGLSLLLHPTTSLVQVVYSLLTTLMQTMVRIHLSWGGSLPLRGQAALQRFCLSYGPGGCSAWLVRKRGGGELIHVICSINAYHMPATWWAHSGHWGHSSKKVACSPGLCGQVERLTTDRRTRMLCVRRGWRTGGSDEKDYVRVIYAEA